MGPGAFGELRGEGHQHREKGASLQTQVPVWAGGRKCHFTIGKGFKTCRWMGLETGRLLPSGWQWGLPPPTMTAHLGCPAGQSPKTAQRLDSYLCSLYAAFSPQHQLPDSAEGKLPRLGPWQVPSRRPRQAEG